MSIADRLPGSGIRFVIDGRAPYRGDQPPAEIRIEATGLPGNISRDVAKLVAETEVPFAYVTSDGTAWILALGGSGRIVYAGIDAPSDQQRAALEVLSRALKAEHRTLDAQPLDTSLLRKPEPPAEIAVDVLEEKDLSEPTVSELAEIEAPTPKPKRKKKAKPADDDL